MLSLGLLCDETLMTGNKGESPSLRKDGKLTRCKSENHVPILAVSQELRPPDVPRRRRATDCESQVPEYRRPVAKSCSIRCPHPRECGHRVTLHFPGVQAPGNWSHKVPEWLELFLKKASLVNSPTHLMSWWNNLQSVVEPKEKPPDEMRVSPKEEATDLPVFAEWS